MSGEAVVVTAPIVAVAVAGPVLLAGAAVAGGVALGTLAARGVARGVAVLVDQQLEAARQRAREERRRQEERAAFERRQRAADEESRQRHAAIANLQQRLRQVHRQQPPTPAASGTTALSDWEKQVARNEAARSAMSRALRDIATAIAALPASVCEHPGSPVPSLRQQAALYLRQLEGGPLPDAVRVEDLKATAERSLGDFLRRVEAEREARAQRLRQVDAALELAAVLEQLPGAPMGARRAKLAAALERGDISAGELATIEADLEALAKQAMQRVASGALRPALAESLLRHLRDLGYALLSPFPAHWDEPTVRARVRGPEGGQVAIRLDEDARLRFGFEREPGTDAATAKAQEARWCRDLARVVASLMADGFDSRATFERTLIDIPVVTWERFVESTPAAGKRPREEATTKEQDDAEQRRRQRMRADRANQQRRSS